MAKDPLKVFLKAFKATFYPPPPKERTRGDWLVSRKWSDYMRAWLKNTFSHQRFEYPHTHRQRLDAALWGNNKTDRMDIALEWEWDDNKVRTQFPTGDFKKILEVNAFAGLAIVQTRSDGKPNGNKAAKQADRTIAKLRRAYLKHKIDDRPIGVMEFRRTYQTRLRVEFVWRFHNLKQGTTVEGKTWRYATDNLKVYAPDSVFDYKTIRPLRDYFDNGRCHLDSNPGLYAFWWLGRRQDLLKSQRQITLKGPGGKLVHLVYGDWFPKGVPHAPLYIGKSTNIKNRILQHLLKGTPGRVYPKMVNYAKVKPRTTSCQLRTGIEHIFPTDTTPLALIMKNVGLCVLYMDGDNATADRFYQEDYAIGYYKPWFNLDSER